MGLLTIVAGVFLNLLYALVILSSLSNLDIKVLCFHTVAVPWNHYLPLFLALMHPMFSGTLSLHNVKVLPLLFLRMLFVLIDSTIATSTLRHFAAKVNPLYQGYWIFYSCMNRY